MLLLHLLLLFFSALFKMVMGIPDCIEVTYHAV